MSSVLYGPCWTIGNIDLILFIWRLTLVFLLPRQALSIAGGCAYTHTSVHQPGWVRST